MLLTFSKDSFEEKIKSGIKKHTIRDDINGRWKAGMKIHFWRGNPRNVKSKNKPHSFGYGICHSVENIKIYPYENKVQIYGKNFQTDITQPKNLELLAKNDGFESWEEMKYWFKDSVNDFGCYRGKIIFWKHSDCKFSQI